MNILTAPGTSKGETRTWSPRRPAVYTIADERDVVAVRPAVEVTSSQKVLLDPPAMEIDRLYSYRISGREYAAARRSDGRLDFYELPSRRK